MNKTKLENRPIDKEDKANHCYHHHFKCIECNYKWVETSRDDNASSRLPCPKDKATYRITQYSVKNNEIRRKKYLCFLSQEDVNQLTQLIDSTQN